MRKRGQRVPASKPERTTPEESRKLAKHIGSTRLFSRYQRFFTEASGMPLSVRPAGKLGLPPLENRFCSLVSRSPHGCLACMRVQIELEEESSWKAVTRRCFAGLSESLIPIRSGRRIIAFLQTGQVATGPLDPSGFEKVKDRFRAKGIVFDSTTAETAYLDTKTLNADAYEGFLGLLEVFAETLGTEVSRIRIAKAGKATNPSAQKAIRHIRQNLYKPITLGEISKIAGTSTRHFSKVFKRETGMTFVDYLTHERIEQSKKRIRLSKERISEIAFACGFASIAQFNRAFKRICGETPSAYRLNANGPKEPDQEKHSQPGSPA